MEVSMSELDCKMSELVCKNCGKLESEHYKNRIYKWCSFVPGDTRQFTPLEEPTPEQLYICDHAGECEAKRSKRAVWCKDPFKAIGEGGTNWLEHAFWNTPCFSADNKIVNPIPYKEEKPMKYKVIKDITLDAVIKEQGGMECSEFREVIKRVMSYYMDDKRKYLYGYLAIDWDWLHPLLDAENVQWLLDHGLIERVEPEVLYGTGDRFSCITGTYILASNGEGKAVLVNLKTGNSKCGAVKPSSYEWEITKDELYSISRDELTKIND